MTEPEEFIRMVLGEEDIEAFSTYDAQQLPAYVVMVRTTDSRLHEEVTGAYRSKTVNILLHCFTVGQKVDAYRMADKVSDLVSDIARYDLIEQVTVSGGSPLPQLNDREGYSLSVAVTVGLLS